MLAVAATIHYPVLTVSVAGTFLMFAGFPYPKWLDLQREQGKTRGFAL